jgi:ADP-heptose:LPS heptosyltransferase
MKKILIVNLRRFGDIFQTQHLIDSIKRERPGVQVDLLCYKEMVRAAKVLGGVKEVHTLDRKKIISYFKNNIYSDGLALNELHQSLVLIREAGYDKVLNYSNDKVSTYICSYLVNSNDQALGISFTPRQTLNYSGPYSIVLNDVVTQSNFIPYSFNDLAHHICDMTYSCNFTKERVRSNKAHDKTARNNLNRLRSSKSEDISGVSIIGFQLFASSKEKEIPEETLVETIRHILASEKMVPILLLAPNPQEREMANRLNQKFNNRLVSVEADFIALPSVLKNIDLVVTPDTAVKHLSDLVNTPVVEVSLGASPLFKQGSVNPNSIIISRPANLRTFRSQNIVTEQEIEKNKELKGQFLFDVIKGILIDDLTRITPDSTNGFCLYRPTKVVDGVTYFPIAGDYDGIFEAKRIISRSIIQKVFKGVIDENVIDATYKQLGRKNIQRAIEDEKHALSILTKELLSTLRGLIQTQENKNKAPVFIEALEKLLSHCFDNNLAAIHALNFRAKIESLNSSSLEANFKEVEGLLYELKDNLQSSLYVFKRYEDIGYSIKTPSLRTNTTRENTL